MPIVDPSLIQPILVAEPAGEPDSAMKVTFAVPVRNWQVNLSLSLCIRVTIGGVTISIYYNKNIFATGQTVPFEALLPLGSEILDSVATYNIAYL